MLPSLVLTDQQVQCLKAAGNRLVLVDSAGHVVGAAMPRAFSEQEVEEARRRLASGQRRYSPLEKAQYLEQLLSELDSAGDAHDAV